MASLDKFAGQTVEYAVGFGLGFALGRALTPVGNAIIQEAYGKDPNKPLDVHDVAALLAERLDVPGGAHGEQLSLVCIAGGERIPQGEPGAGSETVLLVKRTLSWIGWRWVDEATGRPAMAQPTAEHFSAEIFLSRTWRMLPTPGRCGRP